MHLHVIGGTAKDKYYSGSFKALLSKHEEWVFFEGRMSDRNKRDLVAMHRFGISARKNEPFGIAVAEMTKVGCITFVPNGGGQVEIVGHPDLIYDDIDDAVSKIEKVLTSRQTQDALQRYLADHVQRFSAETFKQSIRNIVSEFLQERRHESREEGRGHA